MAKDKDKSKKKVEHPELSAIGRTVHETDIILGDEYEDSVTGLKGIATSVTFFLHACERVALEFLREGKTAFDHFDAPRLIHVPSQVVPVVEKTGGPGGTEAAAVEVEVR